jgi:LuxR family transcriptional activator of bioluminescence operon
MQKTNNLLEIKKLLIEVKERLGFKHILYTVRLPHALTSVSHFLIGDYPINWLDRYVENEYVKIDPVITHCTSSQIAYCWDQLKESTNPKVMNFVNDAATFGFIGGISIGVNTHDGDNSIFSVATDHVINKNSKKYYIVSSYMTALQPYIYDAINRVSSYKQSQNYDLTERELNCLLWSSEGKTSDEIAVILSIKPPTVVFHLKNVIKKLEVTNRNQAIAKAVLLGLITPQCLTHSIPLTYQF